MKSSSFVIMAFLTASLAFASCTEGGFEKTDNGVIVRPGKESGIPGLTVQVRVVNERIFRVTSVPGETFPSTLSLMALPMEKTTIPFTVEESDGKVTVSTASGSAVVSLTTGEVKFTGSDGKVILSEREDGKSFTPVTVAGEKFYTIRQLFDTDDDEAVYGLGANQAGFMNLKGKDADLFQYNTMAVIPFFVSDRNYGLLWDNNSRTKYGDIREWKELSGLKLYGNDGTEGGLTAIYAGRNDPSSVFTTRRENEISYQFIPDLVKFPAGFDLNSGFVTWEGEFEPATGGSYRFAFNSAGYARLWIDGTLMIDRWRQCWNASTNYFNLDLEQGSRHRVKIEWTPDGGESFIAMRYLDPLPEDEQGAISMWSEVAEQMDYYFICGNNIDEVISGYRTVTGKAPMMPRSAMGFWQSRERYKTQDELLGVVKEYRKRGIPIDNIVLDWQYWPIDKWGDHNFDPARFTDPEAMIRTLHEELSTNIMISVWPKYYVGTENYEAMNSQGWLYRRNVEKGQKDWLGYVSTFYDAFNADARKAYWEQINGKLYSKGIDAWWLDASEPDICSNLPMDERKALMNPTALGPAAKVFNAYSLVQAGAVYDGQQSVSPGERVFILTRSAFAGLQRYSAANWSGDIASRWHDMKAQIPCGVNVSMSGLPYWTMDIGGFAVESRYFNPNPADLDEWRELMTRWFQFGTFIPLFRSHGQYPYREIFNIAPENHPAYKAMVSYDRLRYRLMPYIYSLAGHVWLDDYTIMRGLAMDFASDKKVRDISDQYMFGPSILVCPVTEYKARSRKVYLPAGCGWYSLNDGTYIEGGTETDAPAPYSAMPLYAKAGSVIPAGPEIKSTSEKNDGTLTLYVFAGADGSFTLYEDEGVNNNYLSGAYSLIGISYADSGKKLTVAQRKGSFDGMPESRKIRIRYITPGGKKGAVIDGSFDREFEYNGEETVINL